MFSVTDSFVTETRARLGDDSVDSLVFLKNYYDVNKAEKLIVFHFELHKRLVQKIVEFVLNLDS